MGLPCAESLPSISTESKTGSDLSISQEAQSLRLYRMAIILEHQMYTRDAYAYTRVFPAASQITHDIQAVRLSHGSINPLALLAHLTCGILRNTSLTSVSRIKACHSLVAIHSSRALLSRNFIIITVSWKSSRVDVTASENSLVELVLPGISTGNV